MIFNQIYYNYMHARRGGLGGPDPPPWNLQSLISPILLEMKKLVIFHICALASTVIRQGWTPLEIFSGSMPDMVIKRLKVHTELIFFKENYRKKFFKIRIWIGLEPLSLSIIIIWKGILYQMDLIRTAQQKSFHESWISHDHPLLSNFM